VLSVHDLHLENVIVRESVPIVVDLETVFGRPRFSENNIRDAMMSTSLVQGKPIAFDPFNGTYAAAFQQPEIVSLVERKRCILNERSDKMRLILGTTGQPQPGKSVSPFSGLRTHLAELRDGFSAVMNRFRSHQDDLARLWSNSCKGHEFVREIIRPTAFYYRLLWQLSQPESMKGDGGRELILQLLRKNAIRSGMQNAYRIPDQLLEQICECEVQSLLNLDIPAFFSRPSSLDLFANVCGSVRSLRSFYATEFDLLSRLQLASAASEELGLVVIDSVFGAAADQPRFIVTQESFLNLAATLASRLESTVVSLGDWFKTTPSSSSWRLCVYDGLGGVLIAFSALARASSDSHYESFSSKLASALCTEYLTGKRSITMGGLAGDFSLVYALSFAAVALNDAAMLSYAGDIIAATTLIPEEEDKIDVMFGSAGALLCLVSYTEAQQLLHGDSASHEGVTPQVRDLITELSDRLARLFDGHHWNTDYLTGFSHGNAGIAYALLRAYEATKVEKLLATAEQAFEFENSFFSQDENNWRRSLRVPQHNAPMVFEEFSWSWCHGAPGILLARRGDDRFICNGALDALLTGTALDGINTRAANDSLCCGRLGLMDCIMTLRASERMDNLAEKMMCDFASDGIKLSANNFGLFQGEAGVCYMLARLLAPAEVPCLLLFRF